MRLFFNGRFLTQRRSGMQRWAEELLTAFDVLVGCEPVLSRMRPTVITPPGALRTPTWQHLRVETFGRNRGHVWEQVDLLRASSAGLLVNLLSTGPLLHPRQIVTFHDAAVFRIPALFSARYRTLHQALRPALARKATHLLTVSNFSARELSEVLGVPTEKFTVVPNAADHILKSSEAPHPEVPKGLVYGLCVGNQTPNKNVETAIRAFAGVRREGVKLLLVGAAEAQVFGTLRLSDHPDVVRLGYVSDEELKGLYQRAAFLAFPSRYEGCGIPVLEAMALGCPVIASNAAAIPETAGGAALLADPDDPLAFSEHMQRILGDRSLADRMRDLGRKRASDFSWTKSATTLALTIEKLQP